MRQALSVLLNEGLILREHGKGTFVTDLWQPSTLLTYTSRMEDIGPETSRSSVEVLDREMVGGPLSDFADLRLEPGDHVFRLRRVHLVDDSPRAYVVSYLPAELARRLEPEDFERIPLILGMEQRTGLRFPVARQSISASLADDEVAHLLRIPLGSPILLIRRTYFQEDGQPAYVAVFRYPGSQFHFEVQLNRAALDDGLNRTATPSLDGHQGDE
jgi:GntR family transcriptional regulator